MENSEKNPSSRLELTERTTLRDLTKTRFRIIVS